MSHQQKPLFDVSVEHSGTTAVVHVAGELDIATAPELEAALNGLEHTCPRIVLDVSGLEFIDSTGLRITVVGHDRATAEGAEFVIAGASGPVLQVLRLTGLDVTLPLAPDVATAIGAVVNGARRNGTG